jgi:membrane protein DedA with SNARE-associated domain/rhodanese-related sulfurtransferase
VSYTFIAISVFARQLCLPVPALFLLIAAGALARQGKLDIPIVLAMSVMGCLGGDFLWFEAGRRWGRRILGVFTHLTDNPKRASERAHAIFGRWGLRSLLVAKFVPGLDGITPPLAGLEGTARLSFLLYDGMGSLIWSGAYVLGGYLFATQVNRVLALVSESGRIIATCVLIPVLGYIGWRAASILRTVQRLRMKRISPKLLHARLVAGEQIVVIDLLNYQDGANLRPGIEGAVRIDPSRLQSHAQILAPASLAVVLYCSSSDQFRSARVAMSLRRKSIHEVWVLEGGLDEWIAAGLPVTDKLLSEDEIIRRFRLIVANGGPDDSVRGLQSSEEDPEKHATSP